VTKRFRDYKYLSSLIAKPNSNAVFEDADDETASEDRSSNGSSLKSTRSYVAVFPKSFTKSLFGLKLTDDELNQRCSIII
jgi:hypothetical protein